MTDPIPNPGGSARAIPFEIPIRVNGLNSGPTERNPNRAAGGTELG
jgi:hypothetical protein